MRRSHLQDSVQLCPIPSSNLDSFTLQPSFAMNAWGAPTQGAWAAQVDEEEQANGGTLDAPKEPVITFGQDKAFPTLGEAVKKKESKKDKKKPQKMNLADFQSNYKPPSASRRPTVNDDQLKASLPTAPRARDSDEPSAGLGGAFRDYGGGDRGASCLVAFWHFAAFVLAQHRHLSQRMRDWFSLFLRSSVSGMRSA